MKKLLKAILCVVLIISVGSCGSKKQADRGDEETFYVDMTQACDSAVYGIHLEYYLGDKPIGGSQIINADSSTIRKGDKLSKDFIPQDFPEGADLSTFSIEFFIINEKGGEEAVKNLIAINAEYGKTYSITISQDAAGRYMAQYIEEEQ